MGAVGVLGEEERVELVVPERGKRYWSELKETDQQEENVRQEFFTGFPWSQAGFLLTLLNDVTLITAEKLYEWKIWN